MWHLEQKQRKTKLFIYRHRQNKEKLFAISKLVLVFQTKMGAMPGKLWFRCTGPYWIVNSNKGMYEINTLAGEVLPMGEWVQTQALSGTVTN